MEATKISPKYYNGYESPLIWSLSWSDDIDFKGFIFYLQFFEPVSSIAQHSS